MRQGKDIDARDPGQNIRMSTTPVVRFGGKARAAPLLWRLLGPVDTFVDPLCGGVSVPLKCPYELRRVVINDRDSLVANFWRAVQFDPEAVAWWADYPTVHDDLIARREWLRQVWPAIRDGMQLDPWLYDAQVAGVWVWAVSNSIDLLQLTVPTPEEREAYWAARQTGRRQPPVQYAPRWSRRRRGGAAPGTGANRRRTPVHGGPAGTNGRIARRGAERAGHQAGPWARRPGSEGSSGRSATAGDATQRQRSPGPASNRLQIVPGRLGHQVRPGPRASTPAGGRTANGGR